VKNNPDFLKFLKHVGTKLRKMRVSRGWSLEDTEDHGWHEWRRLQQIESGQNITLATLWKVAELYNIPPAEILKD
jgi:hypothetical protein